MKYVNQYSDDIQRYNEEHWSQLYKEGLITKEQAIAYRDRAVYDNKDYDVIL